MARGAVSLVAAGDIYGVVLAADGSADAVATEASRAEIRRARLAGAVAIDPGDAIVSFAGVARLRFGDALEIDATADAVTCAQCGHRHCGPRDNLLPHLRELLSPLSSAGPVRGEDYDVGRFKLRQLCCANCGTLVDTQVALDGAPRPFMRLGAT
ncbi:MAG: hypothetical protein FJX53_06355 [Alphaproteobacteria bacterium]|nr:hypothetical protein [Alphaproteobacteria bacterium]